MRLALYLWVILSGLVLVVTPFAVEDKPGTMNHLRWGYSPVRYGTCFLSLSVIAFAWLLDRLQTKFVVRALARNGNGEDEKGPVPTRQARRTGDQSQSTNQSPPFSFVFHLPSLVSRLLRLPSSVFRLSSSVFRLPSSVSRRLLPVDRPVLLAWLLPAAFAGLIAYQLLGRIERIRVQVLDSLLLGADLLMLAGILYLIWDGWPRLRRMVAWVSVVTFAAAVALGTFYLGRRWHEGFARHYDRHFGESVFTQLATIGRQKTSQVSENSRSLSPFARLAGASSATTGICVLDHRPYPFFGSARQYRVCQPSVVPSYEELVQFLADREVTIVATRVLEDPDPATTGRFRWTYQWLSEHPDRFELIERGFWFAVFRFRR